MYKIKSGVFCARGYLARNSVRGCSFLGLKVSAGYDFTQYSRICLNPANRFCTQDIKNENKPAEKQDDKLVKHKSINLTSEQIKTLFYQKVAEPIALISLDKYYSAFREKQNKSTQIEHIQSLENTSAQIPREINITSSIENNITTASVINNEANVEQSVREDVASANVINTILEKELVDDGGKFGTAGAGSKEGADNNLNSWRAIKYVFFLFGTAIAGAVAGIVMFLGAPKLDEDDELVLDKYSEMPVIMQYLYRTVDELHNFNKLIKDPSREKLLPDVLQPPYYQPPYTLILEFTDLLVHPEWTYSTGWRFKKRPGLDQFLETLYTRYEMVVYTAEMGMTVFPIIETLDKNNLISYKLVRDATKFMDGHHVKDLDKLNRDLSKVIVLDWNAESTQLHTENLFRIPRWNGNDDDTTLIDLTALLIAISEWKVEDVRSVLKYYSEFDDPLGHFKERQKMLAAQDL